MNADLERLIALQQNDSAAEAARRRLAEEPEHEKALAARLETAREHVATARERLAGNQTARRALEKDVALHQGRLSRFRDQMAAVKTNVEYQAMQKEIGFAQDEVKAIEDRVLERMLEADDLTAAVKRAETELAAEEKAVDADRRSTTAEHVDLLAAVERMNGERAALVAAMDKQVLALFDAIARKRNGIAVAEARGGICTICHVRLRPQVFNSVRRNDSIMQCDHCNRILYFVPAPAAAATPDGATQQTR